MRYGTRTYRRKGYLFMALAAAVLLAASAGPASAQTLAADDSFSANGLMLEVAKVEEGDSTTITVSIKATVTPADPADSDTAAARTVAVTVTAEAYDSGDGTAYNAAKVAEVTDYAFNPTTANMKSIVFPADTEGESVVRTATFTLYTNPDPDAEDEDIKISVEAANPLAITGEPAKTLTIEDDETQTYALTLDAGQKPTEKGMDIAVTLAAVPAHVDGSKALTLISSDSVNYKPSLSDVVLGSSDATPAGTGSSTQAITIPAPGDKNRVADTFTLSVHSGVAGRSNLEDTLDIKVADVNELPAVTAMVTDKDGKVLDPQPTSVAEGTSIHVAVMPLDDDGDVQAFEGEDLAVVLTPTGTADSADYTLVGSFTIKDGVDASDAVKLEVRSDEDVGTDTLMFDAVVSGDSNIGPGTSMSANVLSLTIEDETATKITPKASAADYEALMAAIAAGGGEDGVNPGDTVTLMTSDLFDVESGYTASYGVSVEGDAASASASGDTVTINAMMAGEAKITVTGTARMASSSLIPSQTVSNVAELTFPVMVVDTTLVVTLSADPMEIEAGGTTMITATANRAVTAGDGAVTINLTVVGDGTLDAESITIAMGEMSGSVMLTANESVTVVATGSGVSGLMQVMVTVTDVPEPVPALGLIAQWLLGLGLLGGGARQLYRRRRQG